MIVKSGDFKTQLDMRSIVENTFFFQTIIKYVIVDDYLHMKHPITAGLSAFYPSFGVLFAAKRREKNSEFFRIFQMHYTRLL